MMKCCGKKNICIGTTSNQKNKINCSCVRGEIPSILKTGGICSEKLNPILADVVRNCITIDRYETAYFGGTEDEPLAVQIDLTGNDINVGDLVRIKCINYSYDCLGPYFPFQVGVIQQDPIINAIVDGNETIFTGTNLSCRCLNSDNLNIGFSIYNDFVGSIKSKDCLCSCYSTYNDLRKECYFQNKISERNVFFGLCNPNILVSGCIGNKCFTGSVGFYNIEGETFQGLNGTLPLEDLGFPAMFNFTGKICLPSNQKIILNESFDNCLKIDCIRPDSNTIVNLETNPANSAVFAVNLESSLSIRKTINAITRERLSCLSNYDEKVICSEGEYTKALCITEDDKDYE